MEMQQEIIRVGGLPINPPKTWKYTRLLYIFHFHLIIEEDTSSCGFSFHYFLQTCVNNLNCTLDTGLVNYYNEYASKLKSVWLFEETERRLLVGCRYLMLITLVTVQF